MKGPQFREQNNINWNKNKRLCKEAIKKYRDKWCMREMVDKRVLNGWMDEVNCCVMERINRLRQTRACKQKKQILRNSKHRDFLDTFHRLYVLVPADKAANNVIVVCRKYYLQVILEELGVHGAKAYTEVTTPYEDIITAHLSYV